MSTDVPDFVALTRFLLEPFLDSPQSLRVNCEFLSQPKVWVRVAVEGEDKGRVFGRGGRNIHAVRSVLQSIAQLSGYVAHLDVYGGSPAEREETEPDGSERGAIATEARSPQSADHASPPKPRPRLRREQSE